MDGIFDMFFTVFLVMYSICVVCLYYEYFTDKESRSATTKQVKWHRSQTKVVNYTLTKRPITKTKLVVNTIILILLSVIAILR